MNIQGNFELLLAVLSLTPATAVDGLPEEQNRSTDSADEIDRASEEIRSLRERTQRRTGQQGSPSCELSWV
jgi:hypothetical protein